MNAQFVGYSIAFSNEFMNSFSCDEGTRVDEIKATLKTLCRK